MVHWGYVSQSIEQNELGLSEPVTVLNWRSEEDIVKTDKIYCITVANGLSNSATPDTKTTKTKPPLRNQMQSHQSPRKGCFTIKMKKNKATVQFLRPKHKVVTSVSERRRMTRVSSQTLK